MKGLLRQHFLITASICLAFISGSCQISWGQRVASPDLLLQENAAAKLLHSSREYQKNGQFSQAAKELVVITDYYPDYSQIDEIYKELGDILISMELYSAADKIYKHLIETYRGSAMTPFALYGLEKVNYLQGRHYRTLQMLHLLLQKFPKAEIGDGKFYYAGQSHLALEEFDDAIAAFDKIHKNSEFRGYGLYSRAMANIKKKILLLPSKTSNKS